MRSRPGRRLAWLIAAVVALSSSACAGNVAVLKPRRPPLPDDRAIDELVLVCQPLEDEGRPCSPTRITVEVCASDLEAGCKVRRGIHDLLSDLDAYDDYVAELRGEEVEP